MPESRSGAGKRNSVDARVAAAAAEQWGVLSWGELRELGLSGQGIARRERGGRLHRLRRGVYAVGYVAASPEARWLAAVKACGPGAVLSHRSAAELWGFLDPGDRHPEVTVPGPGTRLVPGIVVRRSGLLGPRETTSHREIPVTTPARTLVDVAAVMPGKPLREAVRRAQGLRWVGVSQLLSELERLRSHRGCGRVGRVIATGPAPTRSTLEDIVLDLLLGGGFEHPDVNRPLELPGRRVVPDFRWPRQRLIVEADGGAWHDQKVARKDDAERQALLEAHGERVLRVTWSQAVSQPGATLRRIAAAEAPRSSVD